MNGKWKEILIWLGLVREHTIFYIGGSDVLPPPLKGPEEQSALEGLERGDEVAKQKLIENNYQVYSVQEEKLTTEQAFRKKVGENKID